MSLVPPSSRGGVVLVATKHLTSAMILDIANTPVAGVPTPAANEVILPIGRLYRYLFGGQAYDSDAGFALAWESNLAAVFGTQTQSLLVETENAWDGSLTSNAGAGGDDSNPFVPLGSALMVVSPAAAFAPPLGNGTVNVTIWYLLLTVT